MDIKIGNSNIVTAFDDAAIGSKVVGPTAFKDIVRRAVAVHDFAAERVPGQAYIDLGNTANACLSAGVGKRPEVTAPVDYVVRYHRGRCDAYLKREYAADVERSAVVAYTLGAYAGDPEVSKAEVAKLKDHNVTHVLVAVLAFAGPESPLTPHRFVSNLAGGNKEAAMWNSDEVRAKAREVHAYDTEWCVVAD